MGGLGDAIWPVLRVQEGRGQLGFSVAKRSWDYLYDILTAEPKLVVPRCCCSGGPWPSLHREDEGCRFHSCLGLPYLLLTTPCSALSPMVLAWFPVRAKGLLVLGYKESHHMRDW
jgi:hypothetical protein